MSMNVETLLSLYVKGTKIWVVDEQEGWIAATVSSKSIDGDNLTLVLIDDRQKEATVTTSISKLAELKDTTAVLPPLKNPPMLEGIDDLTSLSYLHEPAVLHNIRTRYAQHNIYTYSGIVLIAMNPFQKVQLYSPDVVRAYSGKRRGELEPHLFAVSEDAFRSMIREGKNQSIIVSGESGAGKTVSAKYIMRYLATADSDEKQLVRQSSSVRDTVLSPGGTDTGVAASEVEEQVLATNPIMESFGNAKTTRNDNSSRFGKYIELLFDKHTNIVGARIRTYLLERSRVVFQPESERNYHIFYQLCAGAPAAEKKELGLGSHTQFFYLNQGGGNGVIPGVDDAAEFEITQRALSTIGVSVSVQWQIFRLLAALLHLGNMEITQSRSDEATISDTDPALMMVAKLLHLSLPDFKKWLLKKQIITRSEKIVKTLTAAQSMVVRESVSKYIYSGLFEWIVTKINDSLCTEAVKSKSKSFIGVLDIYGFEHFKRNSFEQFCINYANEKLQQEFNSHVFKLEQEEYVKEQINWSFIEFNDNQPCIELIEGKLGILSLLDEESRLPSGSDKSYIDKLYQHFTPPPKDAKSKTYFSKPRFSNSAFIVHHFAHDVAYEVDGFLEKNKDTVPDEILEVFNESNFPFVKDVIACHKVGHGSNSSQSSPSMNQSAAKFGAARTKQPTKQTLGSVFKASLNELMTTINSTNVSYIRCIKPNSSKTPFSFDAPMVLSQLRACGVLETIRISTLGFPGRWSFEEFADRYYLLVESKKWSRDVREMATVILKERVKDEERYQVGLTKLFFKAGQLAYLEKLRSDKLNQCVTLIQKNIRRFIARRKYLRLRKAAVKIQSLIRGKVARNQAKSIRQTKAATTIQKYWRGYYQREAYKTTRNAAIAIQCTYRSYKARQELSHLRQQKAALQIQKVYRGYKARKEYQRQRKLVILLQSCTRRRAARKQLKSLKVEARSLNHIQELKYRLENKVVELTQSLAQKENENKMLLEKLAALENQVKSWKEKYENINSNQKELERKLNDSTSGRKEVEGLMNDKQGLQSKLNAANDIIKSKDTDISNLQLELTKQKEEIAKLKESVGAAAKNRPGTAQTAAAAHGRPGTPKVSSATSPTAGAIAEATTINALTQQIATLKQQLAEMSAEKDRLSKISNQTSPISPTSNPYAAALVPGAAQTQSLWQDIRPITPPSSVNGAGESGPLTPKRQRRYSSVEAWTSEEKETAELDRKLSLSVNSGVGLPGRISPRTVEEALMEQEHTFTLLQDPKLENEIVERLVKNLKAPAMTAKDCTRREVFFPAHVIGLFVIKLWQHGLTGNMQSVMTNCMRAVLDKAFSKIDEDELPCFWLSNLFELLSIIKSTKDDKDRTKSTQERYSSGNVEMDRGITKIKNDLEFLIIDLFLNYLRAVKKRLQKLIVPAVIENQSLPGFISKDSSSGAGGFLKMLVPTAAYTIENLLDFLSNLWKVMKFYYVDDSIVRQTYNELLKMIGVSSFNHLIMRKNFCTWKRGMQIQYNVSRLIEWCNQHALSEGALHLERLMQAAKLLQLNKATPQNIELYIEDLFDVCFLLSPTQIKKLMSIYTVADFENPISPEILKAVARRSVSSEKNDVLLLEMTPDNDSTWFEKPEPRRVQGIEKYLPGDLEMELPRVILLFKFA
ncbi:putative class V myosin [Paraphysoderma sedebokerense]|nr:putative class V myosin [Paraphysoderma sedebokerense]